MMQLNINSDFQNRGYDGLWCEDLPHREVNILRNGDSFRGVFLNGECNSGTYTIKNSGDYYTGSFKNCQQYKGQ